jgi:translation initiation factor IF-3
MEAGHKVKFTVRFRGREITHPEKAHEQIDIIVKALEDVCNVETRPMMEARAMSLVLAPKPAIMQRVQQQRAALEKARQLAEKEGRPMPAAPSSFELPEDEDDDDDDDDEDDEAEETAEKPAEKAAEKPETGDKPS